MAGPPRRAPSSPAEHLATEGKTPLLVAIEGPAVAVVAAADSPKPNPAAAVAELHRRFGVARA